MFVTLKLQSHHYYFSSISVCFYNFKLQVLAINLNFKSSYKLKQTDSKDKLYLMDHTCNVYLYSVLSTLLGKGGQSLNQ